MFRYAAEMSLATCYTLWSSTAITVKFILKQFFFRLIFFRQFSSAVHAKAKNLLKISAYWRKIVESKYRGIGAVSANWRKFCSSFPPEISGGNGPDSTISRDEGLASLGFRFTRPVKILTFLS